VPELRRDERLQLKRSGNPSGGFAAGLLLGAVIGVQAFLALAARDGWSVLLAPDHATWLLVALLWIKDLAFGLAAFILATALFRRFSEDVDESESGGSRGMLALAVAAGVALGVALRWVGPGVVPPAQFSDTFSEIERVLRDPGAPWLGTTPFPGETHDQVSNLYARTAHVLLTSFGGREVGLLAIAAVPATLLLPAVLWLGAEVWGARVGAVALALVACASWPLNIGRWGFTGSAMLPLLAGGTAAVLAGDRTHRPAWGAVGGLGLGLALHTHPGAWAVVGLLALCGLALGAARRVNRRVLMAATLGGAVALAPFAYGFVGEPARLGGHLKDVYLLKRVRDVKSPAGTGLTGGAARIAYNLVHYTAVFTGADDPNPRHALPGSPALPLAVGLAALFGAAAGLRPGAAVGERVLLVFGCGALLAGVLADPGGVPNTFRICALIVPAFLWAAFSIERVATRLAPRFGTSAGAVLALTVAALLVSDGVPFLARWSFDPRVERAFEEQETEAGRRLLRLGEAPRILDPGAVRHPLVLEVLSGPADARIPLPRLPLRTPAGLVGLPPGSPFWYVSNAQGLGALRSAGWKCARGIATSGEASGIVIAWTRPPRSV
jgi:hypothetical protein